METFSAWFMRNIVAGNDPRLIEGKGQDGVYMILNKPRSPFDSYTPFTRGTAEYYIWIDGQLVKKCHSTCCEAISTYYRLKGSPR